MVWCAHGWAARRIWRRFYKENRCIWLKIFFISLRKLVYVYVYVNLAQFGSRLVYGKRTCISLYPNIFFVLAGSAADLPPMLLLHCFFSFLCGRWPPGLKWSAALACLLAAHYMVIPPKACHSHLLLNQGHFKCPFITWSNLEGLFVLIGHWPSLCSIEDHWMDNNLIYLHSEVIGHHPTAQYASGLSSFKPLPMTRNPR